jgi:RNA polymerase sigma factor (sigma-70 family)
MTTEMLSVEEYMNYTARIVKNRYGKNTKCKHLLDDFISCGYVGLTKAYKSFDPSLGVSFKTYLSYKVMGEVGDYLKSICYLNSKYECRRANELPTDPAYFSENYIYEYIDTEVLLDKLQKNLINKLKIQGVSKRNRNIIIDRYFTNKKLSSLPKKYNMSKHNIYLILHKTNLPKMIEQEIEELDCVTT